MDGTANGYVNGSAAAVSTQMAFTVSAWVKPGPLGDQAVLSQNGSANARFFLGIAAGKFTFAMARTDTVGATVDSAVSAALVVVGVWTHLVGVFDAAAGTIKIYVDNGSSATGTHTTTFAATGNTQVGRSILGTYTNFLTGSVDDVRILRWAVNVQDVSNLFTSTGGSPGSGGQPPAIGAGVFGALVGSSATAVALGGGGSSLVNYNGVSAAPAVTVECRLRATGSVGGSVGGFTTATSGVSAATTDRVRYLDSGGRIGFGVITTGGNVSLRSPAVVNDAGWHHVVGTAGPAGIVLYLDGEAVDSHAGATLTMYAGYWRFGAAYLGAWPNRPSRDYLMGTLDEVAVYHRALTAREVSEHFHANR
ncbi:LamG-like jellyroll fold domain-containing protein [Micromonosporaceae bacterium Da 78-11]